MIGLRSLFKEEQLEFIEKNTDLRLSDTKDYSDDDLDEIYCQLTDELPYSFDRDGYPLEEGRLFEDIIDVFVIHRLLRCYK